MSGESTLAPRGRIALLPEVVRNQIAAGEVIERPASIVKELVENALDAGASRVTIELEEGGMRLVRVSDDGSGMGAEDLALAFVPHATSKLRAVSDLEHIASLGFRGEALASMGAVARCAILSRARGDGAGARVEDEGGRIVGPAPHAAAEGTSVEVRDLFYNTPARRHFLKRPATELARCLEVVQRIALSLDGVGFVVLHDGRRALDIEADMDLRARIRRVFGAELANELLPLAAADGDLRLEGFLAPPRLSRRDATRQMFFLNGRHVRDKVLVRAVQEAHRGFLVEGRQAVCFLRLSIDPAAVDVNVHPTKTEVRFKDSRRIVSFLVHHLREVLRGADLATPGERMIASARRREEREGTARFDFPIAAPRRAPEPALEVRDVPGRPFVAANDMMVPRPRPRMDEVPASSASPNAPAAPRGRVLQVDRTYLLREVHDAEGGFEIVDQHALHERITFEALREEVRRGSVEIQGLLVPEVVECSRADLRRIEPHLDELRAIGIDLAVFGEAALAVNGLPARLRRPDVAGLVADLLAVLEETGKPPRAEDVLEEVLHRMACRSSVMAGDELTPQAIEDLFARGRELDCDQTCPHARPTRVRFTRADLEKAFHRR